MPDEQDPTNQETPTLEVSPKPTVTPPALVVAPPVIPEPTGDKPKVIEVPHGDFKKIKDEARSKGRTDALSELDAVAKEAGFASMADALKSLKKPANETTPPAATLEVTPAMPKPIQPSKDEARLRATEAKNAEEKVRMRKQWRSEQRGRRDLQRQLDAKDAEMELREEMYTFGVKDVDYGLRLLTRELQGKSEEEIGKFDRKAFFDGIRVAKPYLFGETVAPATTGTGAGGGEGAPGTPPAGDPAAQKAAGSQFDARTAKPEDVQKRLQALGLNPHAAP